MKQRKRGQAKKSPPKQSLNLPDLDQARSAVLNSLPSKESQRGYRHAIDEFIAWYCSEPRLSFNKAVVTRYRIHLESRQLAPNTINGRAKRDRHFFPDAFSRDPLLLKFSETASPKYLVSQKMWRTRDNCAP